MSKPTDVPESTKLLPCPFCGNQPHLSVASNGAAVSCMDDDCPANSEVIGDTREQAISAWNQRTPAASPVAPPESDEERDGNECARCFATIGTPYGLEPTEVCNLCAQEERLELKQKLAKLASPVAGGSARIAEIRQRVEVARISDSALTNTLADDLEFLLKLVPEGWVKVTPETMPETGVSLIAAERARQMHEEGWTPEHDDEHDGNQIAMAAACYASPVPLRAKTEVPCGCRSADCPHSMFGKQAWVDAWPWEPAWDKRKKHDRLRQLAIAGALIAAEIDRLKRLPPAAEEERSSL